MTLPVLLPVAGTSPVKPAPTPGDNTPPVVVSLEPPHNATNVPVNANLVITFDENVEKGTGSITLNQGATSQVINLDDAAVEVAGKRVTINPPADFPPATDVSVVIPAGAFATPGATPSPALRPKRGVLPPPRPRRPSTTRRRSSPTCPRPTKLPTLPPTPSWS
jgi:hypothetical protein